MWSGAVQGFAMFFVGFVSSSVPFLTALTWSGQYRASADDDAV